VARFTVKRDAKSTLRIWHGQFHKIGAMDEKAAAAFPGLAPLKETLKPDF
jgi:hypothetical protein